MKFLFLFVALFNLASSCFGENYSINSISIISNTKTQSFIIEQEVLLKNHDQYSYLDLTNSISQSEQKLKNLGIFGDIAIHFAINTNADDPFVSNSQLLTAIPVDLIIAAEDKWTLFPIPMYYYDNKLGNIFLLNFWDYNFFGLNQKIELSFSYNPDFYVYSIDYSYPKVFGSLYYLDLSLSYNDEIDYQYGDNNDEVYRARLTYIANGIKIGRQFAFFDSELLVFTSSTLEFRTNSIELNLIQKQAFNGTKWVVGGGFEYGVIDRDNGTLWGDDDSLFLGISPIDLSFNMSISLIKYFKIYEHSVFGYRLNGFISPTTEVQFDSISYIRGISPGEVRGNYGFYGNVEFRPFLFTLPWPTQFDVFTPVFIDFGNAFLNEEPFDINKTTVVAGAGLRLYPKYIGGDGTCIRLDFGANIPSIINNEPFSDYTFVAFWLEEMF